MIDRLFVDTNVLVYAHDADAGRKHVAARTLLHTLWNDGSGALSPQVLQEFYVNITRKLRTPVTKERARSIVDAYAIWCVDLTSADISAAFRVEDEAHINFWDALIVASAAKAGAKYLLTEDLNHGQVIAGVEIHNPFVEHR